VSVPPAMPASNTVLATLAGLTCTSWPPVCATPLTANSAHHRAVGIPQFQVLVADIAKMGDRDQA
jgi:hypothetical protein